MKMSEPGVDIVSLLGKTITDQSTVIRDLKRVIWILAHRSNNEIQITTEEIKKISDLHSAELTFKISDKDLEIKAVI